MEHSSAELGHYVPTSPPQNIRLHASLKARDSETEESHWKRATSPTSEAETDDLSGASLSSFERVSSDDTQPPNEPEREPARLEPASVPVARVPVHLSRSRALALQKELLAAFSSPSFQKCFSELVRGKKRALYEQLVRKQQCELIAKYGFEATDDGVMDMLQALKKFADDPDVLVMDLAIEEVLAVDREHTRVSMGETLQANHNPKPVTAVSVCDLLRSQLVSFGYAPFQYSIEKLKDDADRKRGRPDPQGYYHLPGRADLALQVQKEILPSFGFEGSKLGVQEMIVHCARFLKEPEVTNLLDAVNAKLGMTPAACRRFRELACSLA